MRPLTSLLAAVLAALVLAAPAYAHAPDAEVLNLGAAHAREHELWRQFAAREQRRPARRVRARAAVAGDKAQIGEWSQPHPHLGFGMHAALLPTGKVLYWSLAWGAFGTQPNAGVSWLWDPAKGTGSASLEQVDPPLVDADGDGDVEHAPIYCSGQSFLPDGRLLVTGGNKFWTTDGTFAGWEGALTFNPWNETWAVQPDMPAGRWYPSQVLTATGTTLILGGLDEQPLGVRGNNGRIESFTPDADLDGGGGVFSTLGSKTDYQFELYPQLFTMPTGDVLMAGPGNWETTLFDPVTGRRHWDAAPGQEAPWMDQQRIGGTAVLRPEGPDGSSTVTNIGGIGYTETIPGAWRATKTTETLDLRPASGVPDWKADAPLNVARANHGTVILPDGTLVAVGGGQGQSALYGQRWTYPDGAARPVELLEPGASSWKLGAAQAEDRGYHSVALLLPDGRVLSAGDDVNPSTQSDTFELYSPPYLFRGARPAIASAPQELRYGQRFRVATTGAAVQRAVLMAPAAVTHSTDMSQRNVPLRVDALGAGGQVDLRAPAGGAIAPPGWYMLFALSDQGVPSVATWVRLGGPPVDPGRPLDGSDDEDAEEQPRDQGPGPRPKEPSPGRGPDGPVEGRSPSHDRPGRRASDRTPPGLTIARLSTGALRGLARTGVLRVRLTVAERARVSARLLLGSVRGRSLALATRTLPSGAAAITLRVPRSRLRSLRGRTVVVSITARDDAGNTRRTLVRARAAQRR